MRSFQLCFLKGQHFEINWRIPEGNPLVRPTIYLDIDVLDVFVWKEVLTPKVLSLGSIQLKAGWSPNIVFPPQPVPSTLPSDPMRLQPSQLPVSNLLQRDSVNWPGGLKIYLLGVFQVLNCPCLGWRGRQHSYLFLLSSEIRSVSERIRLGWEYHRDAFRWWCLLAQVLIPASYLGADM